MTELERYLTEEIATDHADGLVTRREAIRRLGLMGLSAAAASSLLAACTKDPPSPAPAASTAPPTSPPSAEPTASAAPAAPPPPGAPARPVHDISVPGPKKRVLRAAWSPAEQPRGGVLVIHENKGLTDHIRDVTGRVSAAGYSALAIDLLSEEGGTAALGDPANATAALGKVEPDRFVADLRAGLTELARMMPGVKLGAIGFCFGGAMTWRLIGAKDKRLAAAIPFYGPVHDKADFAKSKAAVLAVYAENDDRVNATRDAAEAALKKAKLTHEIVTFPGVGHAFFNDTGPRYDAAAAAKAWARVLEWFGKHLG